MSHQMEINHISRYMKIMGEIIFLYFFTKILMYKIYSDLDIILKTYTILIMYFPDTSNFNGSRRNYLATSASQVSPGCKVNITPGMMQKR